MTFSINNNLSALRAYGAQMGVTANNIANTDSEEFKRSRALLKEGPNQDIQVEISKIDSPGRILTEVIEDELIERELSNVDLSKEITQTVQIQRGYEANLNAIKTQNEMLGSVIDILG